MEQELTNYLNERLKKYNSYLYLKLVKMFGGDYSSIIIDALNIPVLYKIDDIDINYYKKIYDSLSSEEQDLVDYFEHKLGNQSFYIVGSSTGIVTDFMIKNVQSYFSFSGGNNIIVLNSLFLPSELILTDTSYLYSLISYISYNIMNKIHYYNCLSIKNLSNNLSSVLEKIYFLNEKNKEDIKNILNNINDEINVFDNDNLIRNVISRSLASVLADKIHSEGVYIFDNKGMLDEVKEIREQVLDKFKQDKKYKDDIYLLSSLHYILPCCFTNYQRFVHYVGKDNFLCFVDAYKKGDADKIYCYVNNMSENLEQKYMSESVRIDDNSLKRAIKRIKDQGGDFTSEPKN